MPLFERTRNKSYEWGIWEMRENTEELLKLLPINGRDEYLQGMEAFTSDSRRREWLAVRVLLFELLGEMKSVSYRPNGKPYLADESFHLSISHTKGYVAVILSKQHQVGVDIEQRTDRVLKVAHKFVREEELAHIPFAGNVLHLLLIWSAKEVMFKCLNESGIDFREHLCVKFPIDNNQVYLSGYEYCTSRQMCFRIPYKIHDHFVMTWTFF